MYVANAWASFEDFYPGEDKACVGCPALKNEVCLRWGNGRMPFTPSCIKREG